MKYKVVDNNKIIVSRAVKVSRNKIYANYMRLGWKEVMPVYDDSFNLYEVIHPSSPVKGLQHYIVGAETLEEAIECAKQDVRYTYGNDFEFSDLQVEFFSKNYTLERI